jgi:hypothetical protein
LAQAIRNKKPDLVELGQRCPGTLRLAVSQYRETHGHAPNFERLHIFMQPRLQELGVPADMY